MRVKIYKPEQTNFFPIYFATSNINYPQQDIFRPDGFEMDQIFLVSSGSGILKIEGRIYTLEENDLFYISKNIPYEHLSTTENFSSTYITFFGNGTENIKKYYNLNTFGIFKNKSRGSFSASAEKLYNSVDSYELSELCAETFSSVITFFEEACKKDLSPIENVYNYIECNYLKPISLNDNLSVYPYSKAKLCRDFKNKYQSTVFDLILKLRLQHARYILTNNPRLTLKNIITSCGFNDISYFCKMYKRFYGISPKNF